MALYNQSRRGFRVKTKGWYGRLSGALSLLQRACTLGDRMRSFEGGNPIALFVYFAAVTTITMFAYNPAMVLLSLAGAVSFWLMGDKRGGLRLNLACVVSVVGIGLVNPLFSHNGETVLFVLNRNPVTLESVLYGASFGLTVATVMYWMRLFTLVFTTDKLLYVFGSVSPKAALLLSMAFRFVPLFIKQTKDTVRAQRAVGLYATDSVPKKIASSLRVFSIVVTWALENGITTADSMSARGYGTGRRSVYSNYSFSIGELVFMLVTVILSVLTFTGMGLDRVQFSFYPTLSIPKSDALGAVTYFAFGALCIMPAIIKVREEIKWKFLLRRA